MRALNLLLQFEGFDPTPIYDQCCTLNLNRLDCTCSSVATHYMPDLGSMAKPCECSVCFGTGQYHSLVPRLMFAQTLTNGNLSFLSLLGAITCDVAGSLRNSMCVHRWCGSNRGSPSSTTQSLGGSELDTVSVVHVMFLLPETSLEPKNEQKQCKTNVPCFNASIWGF